MTALVRQNTPIETGELRASWETKIVVVHVGARGELVYESGTETEVEYVLYVEHGTGLWGPKHARYVIRPRRPDGWLRWIDPDTGQPVFARRVLHPGSPGNHMLAIGVALTEHEFEQFARAPISTCMRELERQIKRAPMIVVGKV
jgi:hypothetical protein